MKCTCKGVTITWLCWFNELWLSRVVGPSGASVCTSGIPAANPGPVHSMQERSYHIFYMLCGGAPPELRAKLG